MKIILHIDGTPVTLEAVERTADTVCFRLNGHAWRFHGRRAGSGFVLEEESAPGVWRRLQGEVSARKGFRRVQIDGMEAKIAETAPTAAHGSGGGDLSPRAPMPGVVRQVLVKAGEPVTRGQALVILEAMKLQLTLSAGGDATVEAVLAREGELVTEGAKLVKLKAVI